METPKTEEEDEEEGFWNAATIEKELDKLLKTDHVSLLLEHDQLVGPASAHPLCKLERAHEHCTKLTSHKCLTSQPTFQML
jgi:hypothetical protein